MVDMANNLVLPSALVLIATAGLAHAAATELSASQTHVCNDSGTSVLLQRGGREYALRDGDCVSVAMPSLLRGATEVDVDGTPLTLCGYPSALNTVEQVQVLAPGRRSCTWVR